MNGRHWNSSAAPAALPTRADNERFPSAPHRRCLWQAPAARRGCAEATPS